MVPPGDIFGELHIAIGVYLALAVSIAISGYVFHRRVISMILLGKGPARFDQPFSRLVNFLTIVMAQRRVLQRVSLRDRAGLGHIFVFWGFLSFFLSYLLFIFGDAAGVISPRPSSPIRAYVSLPATWT